jgi:hypothetical protein
MYQLLCHKFRILNRQRIYAFKNILAKTPISLSTALFVYSIGHGLCPLRSKNKILLFFIIHFCGASTQF